MEFTSTPVALPSFFTWAKDEELFMAGEYTAERIFCSEQWKTITVVTSDFKYNLKFKTVAEYLQAVKNIHKLMKKLIIAKVLVVNAKEHKFILDLAGAQETKPKKLDQKDWGYMLRDARESEA